MFEFFGNFFLALLLVGLCRFFWTVCGLLIRSKDVGNAIFAVALPLSMLYLMVDKIMPIESWKGFLAGAITGAIVLLCFRASRVEEPESPDR